MKRRALLVTAPLAAAALLLVGASAALAAPVTITFLHANDAYEIAPEKGAGGFAPFMTLLRAERQRNPAAITTFGGDLISPSVLSGLTRGRQMIELTNAIGVQVAVPGNHEFDFGPEVAAERFQESRFPWLGTNILGKDGRLAPLGMRELEIREAGGYRIGFFGILDTETPALSAPGPDLAFADPKATAEAAVKRLKAMGADIVVALTHQDLAEDRALAAAVEGIDVVLGGHDHDASSFYEGGKLIVKAASDLRYLAVVDLVVDRVKQKDKEVVTWTPSWRFVPTAGVTPDPEVQAVVARWEKQLDAELGAPVGRTAVELDSRRNAVRTAETNMGNLIADAIRAATGADIGLVNGGGIRGDRTYPAGTVLTRKDILSELPFGNVTVLIELKGADLLAALENGVSQVEHGAGRFPQVSGLRFAFDPKAAPGARVGEVTIGDAPLDPARTYKVATNDYMLAGGDGFASLAHGKVLIDPSAGTLMASTVMNYVTALGGTVAPKVEGRIRRID
ncbi:bifunctional metallophosphatase/5'-nucleotidase [Benzoatithermus flavus]|uniref:5'-nucleotidase C-terminal domain-containing protein n=1 Tax=Benzoatithermus flavus TaxID=3108223 RepID=A0ABU8XSS7_9PROT